MLIFYQHIDALLNIVALEFDMDHRVRVWGVLDMPMTVCAIINSNVAYFLDASLHLKSYANKFLEFGECKTKRSSFMKPNLCWYFFRTY